MSTSSASNNRSAVPGDNSADVFHGCMPRDDDNNSQRSGEEGRVKLALAERRMNRTVALSECSCIREPRLVTYAEVGDPEGCVAFLMLGMDSHRFMSLLLDEPAKSRGVRLLCLDRPGRGGSSDYADESANRVMEFPEILRAFCRAMGIESFSLVGQSMGACYALRCAQEMSDMVATTVYLISPWVPLSVPGTSRVLSVVEKLPAWLLKGGMAVGTVLPRLLSSVGGLSLMVKSCSDEERAMFCSATAAEVLKAVGGANEPNHGVIDDALVALEKIHPLGFDYRDVSMPVHIFHGRADRMVPFQAAKWMSEEMPACTLSVKMGGTHALMMDSGVVDCVLEFICEDFEHFKRQAADRKAGVEGSGREPAFSFPVHTQHFQAEGCLRCLEGVIMKGWKERYFLLDGYQLHELDGPERRTARRVVDVRGAVARVTQEREESRQNDSSNRVFQFKLVDAERRVLYELGAISAESRAFWIETITKASRFSVGAGHEERQGALSKRLFVTTRPESRRTIGSDRVGKGSTAAGGRGGCDSRWASVSPGTVSLPPLDERNRSLAKSSRNPKATGDGVRMPRTRTPGDVRSRRAASRDYLYGTPTRRRENVETKGK